jgi:hypothetical protein
VIGLTGDDLHIDARIALMCARTALPVVAASRQQVLAVSVLVCERVLGGLDGRLTEQSRAALASVPHAEQWARGFSRDVPITPKAFRQRAAPFTVHTAAEGIAQACIPQPDEMLCDLLIAAISECAAWVARDAGPGARRGTSVAVAARGPVDAAVAP